jgi:hypothetical protein
MYEPTTQTQGPCGQNPLVLVVRMGVSAVACPSKPDLQDIGPRVRAPAQLEAGVWSLYFLWHTLSYDP